MRFGFEKVMEKRTCKKHSALTAMIIAVVMVSGCQHTITVASQPSSESTAQQSTVQSSTNAQPHYTSDNESRPTGASMTSQASTSESVETTSGSVNNPPTPTLPMDTTATSKETSAHVTPTTASTGTINHRLEMINFVEGISQYARRIRNNFLVIPQNGEDILAVGPAGAAKYLTAISGIGREDLFYGYNADNRATPANERNYIISYLAKYRSAGKAVLVTDYCSSQDNVSNSYSLNNQQGFVSYAADQRQLDTIAPYPQPIYGENARNVTRLEDVGNFLYLINPDRFGSKAVMVDAICATNYDLVIVDLFFGNSTLTGSDLSRLKVKNNGGTRLVVCYMSIGEAEDYRYYWQDGWSADPPAWLDSENPDWPGNYKVRYWLPEWQQLIYGHTQSYLDRILAAGFDGVYLDLIDAYEYYMG
jgi:cysteinyl-tRNA synthetase, unknown class